MLQGFLQQIELAPCTINSSLMNKEKGLQRIPVRILCWQFFGAKRFWCKVVQVFCIRGDFGPCASVALTNQFRPRLFRPTPQVHNKALHDISCSVPVRAASLTTHDRAKLPPRIGGPRGTGVKLYQSRCDEIIPTNHPPWPKHQRRNSPPLPTLRGPQSRPKSI